MTPSEQPDPELKTRLLAKLTECDGSLLAIREWLLAIAQLSDSSYCAQHNSANLKEVFYGPLLKKVREGCSSGEIVDCRPAEKIAEGIILFAVGIHQQCEHDLPDESVIDAFLKLISTRG